MSDGLPHRGDIHRVLVGVDDREHAQGHVDGAALEGQPACVVLQLVGDREPAGQSVAGEIGDDVVEVLFSAESRSAPVSEDGDRGLGPAARTRGT